MKNSVEVLRHALAILFSLSLIAHFVICQGQEEAGCPFHLCTAERLGCSNNRLMVDESGCQLCRCEENLTPNRHCVLHGCTADLLGCSAGLKRTSDGCTLCECNSTGSPGDTQDNGASCAPTQCVGLECENLRVDPVTGCSICECETESLNTYLARLGIESFTHSNNGDSCPHSRELLDGTRMTRGRNRIVEGSDVPKFRLTLGKLRKGFTPGQKYKIILKATNINCPFKEFLFEVVQAGNLVMKGKRMHKRNQVLPMTRGTEHSSNCGTGYLEETRNDSSAQARVFPQCRNTAVESDETTNKTVVSVDWTAPACGCVYIRASVVDYTEINAYLDDDTLVSVTTAGANNVIATSGGKINRPLYRTVCARVTNNSKRKRVNLRTKKKKGDPNWIFKECCKAARPRKRSSNRRIICERDSKIYSLKRFYRYSGMRRNCKSAYKTCCREFGSTLSDQASVSSEIDNLGTAPSRTESVNSKQNTRIGGIHSLRNSKVSKKMRKRRLRRIRSKKFKKNRQRTSRRRLGPSQKVIHN